MEEAVKLSKIHQVAVYAKDLDEACKFYRDTLGARFIAQYGQDLLFFDFSGTRILLEKAGRPATLYFWVDDIEAAHRELVSKGVVFDSDPHVIHRDDDGTFGVKGNAEWMAFFKDPSDNIIALATQRSPT